jgi:glycosyltransferase involved in cell wall biosynthesis
MEVWLQYLITLCPEFQWRIWVQDGHVESLMHTQLARQAQIFGGSEWEVAARGSDVFITPGHPNIERFHGTRILVAHGSASFTSELMARYANCAEVLVAVSSLAALTFPGTERHRVQMIRNGVDPVRVRSYTPREVTRHAWGVPADSLIIGFVGRIAPDKRPEWTARAAKAVGAIAVFVGAAVEEDTRRRILAEDASTLFLGERMDIGDIYAALDCVLMGSRFEGFGFTLAESLMAGVPLIATSVGVLQELTPKYGSLHVRLSEHADVYQLGAAVRLALSDTYRMNVRRAGEVALHELSVQRTADEWRRMLLSLWSDKRRNNGAIEQ